MSWILVAIGAGCVALLVRLIYVRLTASGGIDAWYYLSWIDRFRTTRRLPVRLPEYLLDSEVQHYPPGFPLLLAAFPPRVLERVHWIIAPAIDAAAVPLLAVFLARSGAPIGPVAWAALLYAVSPTNVAEVQNLNSRPLGTLLATLFTIAVLALVPGASAGAWVAAVLVGAALILTHKLCVQGIVPVLLALAAASWSWRPLAALAGAFAAAYILTGGRYRTILHAHVHILRFWARHLHDLGAHQVLDSPVYGAGKGPGARHFVAGLVGLKKQMILLALHLPQALVLAGAVVLGWPVHDPALAWGWAVLVTAAVTTFVRPLRFLGEGYKYLKMAAFPASVVAADLATNGGGLGRALVIATTVGCAASLVIMIRGGRRGYQETQASVRLEDQRDILETIRAQKDAVLLCLPLHLADMVVYRTGARVLWGGHSDGFDRLEGFFPVLERPLAHFVATHHATHVLLDERYLEPGFVAREIAVDEVIRSGPYRLLAVRAVPWVAGAPEKAEASAARDRMAAP